MRRLLVIALAVLLAAAALFVLWPAPMPPDQVAEAEPALKSGVQRSGVLIPPRPGVECTVKGLVRGGRAVRAIVQSPRSQLDRETRVESERFQLSLPEQGDLRVIVVAEDGRTATVEAECGGDGVLDVVLVLPAINPTAGVFRGRCLYLETGSPVAGAVLRAGILEASLAAVTAITDEEGRFRLPLAAGNYVVRCAKDADEGAPRRVLIDAKTETIADLFVEGRAAVAGSVHANGEPLPGVLVSGRVAREGVDPRPITTRTDVEGNFLLSGFLPGPVIVEAQSEGRFAEGQALARVELPYAEVRLDLLASKLLVNGIVLSPDGEPVEAARISVVSRERALTLERGALSGPGGDFSVGGLVPGGYRLTAAADGYAERSEIVELRTEPVQLELRLLRSCDRGVIVSPAEPSQAVRIIARPSDDKPGSRTEVAGLTGQRIELRGVVGTIDLIAKTVGSSVRTATRTIDLCSAPDPIPLSIAPNSRTGDLWVRVVDGDGQPVAGAQVWRGGRGSARTDAKGEARFLGLFPDSYLVGARDARPVRVDVVAGQKTEVELVLERAKGQIRGVVLARGSPVEGARILAACADSGRTEGLSDGAVMARSDVEGRFEFGSESGSVCRVRAEHPGEGRSRPATLRAGGDLGVLELLKGTRIAGRVVSAETRTPVSPCTVSVVSVGGAAEVEGRTVYVADPSGRFVVEDVTPGRIGLAVVGEQGRGRVELELAPGERKDGVELEVFARGQVVGRVVNEAGRPVVAANVTVQSGGRARARGQTGGDGRYALEADAGELLQVFASAKGFYPKGTLPFDLIPGAPTMVSDIVLASRGGAEEKEGGIGVVFSEETSGIRILNFVDGSPAKDAGLLPGDLITAINGTPYGREPILNWVVTLRGRAGTPVLLEVERGTRPRFTVTVLRRAVGLPPVPEDAD